MGLDMFLNGYKLSKKSNPEFTTDKKQIYWRKANHIHNWFVTNVQNENDDCQIYEVKIEKLKKLIRDCEEVLKCKSYEIAEEILPTQGGLFFGTTDYGDWYWEEIEKTAKELKKMINEGYDYFEYESSW